jgi:hypothetical protein
MNRYRRWDLIRILCFILISGALGLNASQQSLAPAQRSEPNLAEILKKAGEYCRRLEIASLDFICQERISEKIDLSRDIVQRVFDEKPGTILYKPHSKQFLTSVKNRYLYDYQFIRKEDKIIEKRILLEENGREKSEPNAKLKTSVFRFQDILLGPIGLLGEKWQKCYEYRIVDKEALDGQATLVIQVLPRPWFQTKVLSGKIWIKRDDLAILRIEWHPESIGQYETIKERAEKYKATPLVTSVSEYGFEKNGIRFPSRDFTEEAYLTQKGKKFVRSETVVLYLNYKFFTVETEVQYATSPEIHKGGKQKVSPLPL